MEKEVDSTINKDLRDEYLKTKLKMLGYTDFSNLSKLVDSSAGYRVLGRIGHSLENFPTHIRPVFMKGEGTSEQEAAYKEEIEFDKVFMENQDEFLKGVRSVYEDFGLHMDEKVSAEEWKLYSDVVRKMANLLNKLIRCSKKSNLNEMSTLEQEDVISELIDSQAFSQACKIEDSFMKSEAENFLAIVDAYGYNGEEIDEISSALTLDELVRESNTMSNKREKYISSYEKYEEFLNSLKKHIIIKKGTGMKRLDEER